MLSPDAASSLSPAAVEYVISERTGLVVTGSVAYSVLPRRSLSHVGSGNRLSNKIASVAGISVTESKLFHPPTHAGIWAILETGGLRGIDSIPAGWNSDAMTGKHLPIEARF